MNEISSFLKWLEEDRRRQPIEEFEENPFFVSYIEEKIIRACE